MGRPSALVLALVWGCGGDETTAFPAGLEPLEPSTAVAPAGEGDSYPEELVTLRGQRGGTYWAHGRGYVRAPLPEVWLGIRDPAASIDRRVVARWSVTEDVEPEYPHSYRVRNEVEDIVTVEFDVTWRHGAVEGTDTEPDVTASRWKKTWGTTFISLLEGSVVAREAAAGVTELEFVEHLRAASGDGAQIERFLRDYYDSIVAVTYGRPLPTY